MHPQPAGGYLVHAPEQFVERIRSDAARWAEVIRAANVKVQ